LFLRVASRRRPRPAKRAQREECEEREGKEFDVKRLWTVVAAFIASSPAVGGDAAFSVKPTATAAGDGVKIAFTISAPTDVEVAVLDAAGNAVRHLAAGVLGGASPPPPPLKPGLAQEIVWDGKDDLGARSWAAGQTAGAFSVRVRLGTGVKFDRFFGGDPYAFGEIDSIAADENGHVYVMGYDGQLNQQQMVLRVFDLAGRYVREVMPFPATLPPGAMKDLARWDEAAQCFRPRNFRSGNPDFYDDTGVMAGPSLRLVSVSTQGGILLTDGNRLFALETSGAVRGETFQVQTFGGRGRAVPNSGNGPLFVTAAPSGAYVYLSGPFSATNRYGYTFDPRFPPGCVYRAKVGVSGSLEPFVTVPVEHQDGQGGAYAKKSQSERDFSAAHGPVHQVAADAAGRVYVADREHDRVAVFDEAGKEVGELPVKYPHLIAVHPRTGAIYVLQYDCIANRRYQKVLLKFNGLTKDAAPAARYDFGPEGASVSMALSATKDRTLVWLSGAAGRLQAVEDQGASFAPVKTEFPPRVEGPIDWNRLCVDYARDEAYLSDGVASIWRFSDAEPKGALLKMLAADLTVGYDGLMYIRRCTTGRAGGDFSGPLERYTRDLAPAPYPGGSHVLSKYIYGRYGIAYGDRGIGVAPDGTTYIGFMYGWHKYCVAGFGPDGKPLKGLYLEGKVGGKDYPPDLTSAVIGPLIIANGGLRVDLQGNIYLGLREVPKTYKTPAVFEKDPAYQLFTGSVVKFGPKGGTVLGVPESESKQPEAPRIEMTLRRQAYVAGKAGSAAVVEGALAAYPGLGPLSGSGFGMSGSIDCVCRVPRFDVDRFGRLVIPNAISNSVRIVDNAGNLVTEFGKYGNFDSRYVPAGSPGGAPLIDRPDIPLAWPTGAGLSEKHLYVCDTYSRRLVRLKLTAAVQETCPIK
jgi:hypothetical protein